ncbi:MAG TPA: sigma 54-interacting transcriptional regulator [Candidatus Copromorpha excrementigallinarum]|uniref:Sigma 54-interacting transcriptional regulator n=1 Tax=Candidatus Allocopromorpha excrementigallinarum TaxID=2840742 RepID=A0A9D1L5V6_9FIRM|nr:sigma 54-interacting transcriptional regulator [Candidatus Copromorpha excrementigallinarum]
MDRIDCQKLEQYFNQIPGLLMIDTEGIVFYINDQCAKYLQVNKEDFLGKYVKDVFPETKMIEGLEKDEPSIVFYNSFLGIGISMHVPLYEDGKKVGLAEYDVVQHSERLYELSDSYKAFLDQELKQLAGELMTFEGTKYTINNLVGNSDPMTELKEKIISTAKTSSTVMITGETGTGKELVAHAIHNLSSRRKERFIKVNASSFPESLIESELFGYEGGSFTGANREGKKGKFELADRGTLFIDEINQMPLSVQPKLLRALQEKEIDRIGGDKPIPVDVRIIAASNENLEPLVEEGKFRRDLYYRLNVISLYIPPLRERIEDLESISRSIIDELNAQLGKSVNEIDRDALEMLKQKRWHGNVRELRNDIERAMNFAVGNIIHKEDFQWSAGEESLNIKLPDLAEAKGDRLIDKARDDAEREVIIKVLEYFGNNKSKAAEYLNIARPSLYRKMKRLGIDQEGR